MLSLKRASDLCTPFLLAEEVKVNGEKEYLNKVLCSYSGGEVFEETSF
jgi:hypothetical protein